MDFRLGFGGSFGEETKIIRLDVAPNALTANRTAGPRPGRRRRRRARRDRRGGGGGDALEALGRAADQHRGRGARKRARAARRSARAAPPGADLPRTRPGARPRRGRRRRRRRLRLLRGSLHQHLRAGLLDGPGPVRLPRRRPGPGDRREDRQPRQTGRACCSATVPSASPGWSSRRCPATASASSG